MKRVSPWVWVAAAGVQIAALGLCLWAMEQHLGAEEASDVSFLGPAPADESAAAGPRLGPPPQATELSDPAYPPGWIVDAADATTQIAHGRVGEQSVIFGFYPDGNIRFVDVDGARYGGKAENARARMREERGTRAFTVQMSVAPDRRLQAAFTGGTHDGETIVLDPLVGGSAV